MNGFDREKREKSWRVLMKKKEKNKGFYVF